MTVSVARLKGFTLVEILVVMLIIGILASIAYPSYSEHVRQMRRSEAQGVLLENAQILERHFTRRGAYDAGGVALLVHSPAQGNPVYVIEAALERDSYQLTARAVKGGIMEGDHCSTFTLDQRGQRTPAEGKCWRR